MVSLTLAERADLELAHDGPIPAQAIADKIAQRRTRPGRALAPAPRSVSEQIRSLTDDRNLAAAHARRAENEMLELMANRDRSVSDAQRDGFNREIARKREGRDEFLQSVDEADAEIAELRAAEFPLAAE